MIRPIAAIIKRNLLKLVRDKMRLFFTLFMSGMLLFIFSFVTKSMVTKMDHPLNYLLSGIIIMTVFQASLNNSMNILEDISTGFMKEILVAPIARWQIAIGHIVSSSIISIVQGLLIIIAGLFIGLQTDFIHFIIMLALMCVVGLTFSSLGLLLASLSKESTNFQLIISIITFPLTFLSGAYIPTMAIPKVLMPIIFVNPLTYTTAAFRYVSLRMENFSIGELLSNGVAFNINGFVVTPFLSAVFIMIIGSVFFLLCVKQFERSDFSRIKVFKHGHR
jgi:ABC-2 type transport system permease protein